ncbi:LexA family transcriptional regulator [Flavobacterium sp. Leaf359]|uniref:LexA family protein n=1 Tax=Flavobacterium sp. Leaf359 TaxID=1736351 RepID=UPI000AE439BB|nr:translesion error-prone DNA polymerase V autoproteolytic subunit [Flavobacterium sp. Leaf359]
MKVVKMHENDVLEFYSANTDTAISLPFVEGGVSAGFPSPAEDFLENELDFNATFIKHPGSTFYAKVKGNSMKDAGISNGDIMVIDKSLEPKNGDIAVCYLDGEFTVKTIMIEKEVVWLVAQNEQYAPIKVTAENELIIWGIVINVIKTFR